MKIKHVLNRSIMMIYEFREQKFFSESFYFFFQNFEIFKNFHLWDMNYHKKNSICQQLMKIIEKIYVEHLTYAQNIQIIWNEYFFLNGKKSFVFPKNFNFYIFTFFWENFRFFKNFHLWVINSQKQVEYDKN